MMQQNKESKIPLSSNALLVTIVTYGVPDSNGEAISRSHAMEIFDDLRKAADIHNESLRRHKGYHVVDVGIEGDANSGSVYAWIDSKTKLTEKR